MEIRSLSKSYLKHDGKQRRNRKTELQSRLETLKEKNCNNNVFVNVHIELDPIYEAIGKRAIFRSKSGGLNKVKNLPIKVFLLFG